VSTSIVDTAVRTVTHNIRRQQGIALRAAGDVFKLVSNPAKVPRSVIGTIDQLRTTFEATSAGRAIHASAPLWTNRSRRRHLETLRLPLEDAKTAAKKLGGSLNDLFVTGAAMGALAYHEERDTPVEALNMTFVVSTRADRAMGGNAFTPVPVQVPGHGPQSTEERFEQIRDLMAERRHRVSGGGAMSAIAGIANLLPTSMTTRFARQQASRIDLATSNLRGAPFPTYIAGAAVVAGIPLGPVAGTAGNLTTLSQNGWLDMGLLVDPAAIVDPAGLARNIDDSYRELLAAGGVEASL
jgi:diacylglycerol O-acyltransferase